MTLMANGHTFDDNLRVIALAHGWSRDEAFDHTSAMDVVEFIEVANISRTKVAETAREALAFLDQKLSDDPDWQAARDDKEA